MISAFGVDHGDIEKALFGGGGARVAEAGRRSAGGLPKIFGRKTGGAHKAGGRKGAQYGGFRAPGGARKGAGRHAAY
jgi:hypothetical protein